MDGRILNLFSRLFKKHYLLDKRFLAEAGEIADFSTVILAKSQYVEHKREYVANIVDLFRLIRNECKMLSRHGAKIVWLITDSGSGQYKVSYAQLSEQATDTLATGVRLVVPETWLLYEQLDVELLYKVDSETKYWALLDSSGTLNVTSATGIMASANFFLDALGKGRINTHKDLSLTSMLEETSPPLPIVKLIGLILATQKTTESSSRFQIRWKVLSIVSVVCALLYAGGLSLSLKWIEQDLTQSMEVNQASANQMFEYQNKVGKQLSVITSYHDLLEEHPSNVEIIRLLSKDLEQVAVIQNVQISKQLVQLTGNTDSATDVLALLSDSPYWDEVRFDNRVRRQKEREYFTISAVFNTDSLKDKRLKASDSGVGL